MDAMIVAGKSYPLDRRGFLSDPVKWDLRFAAAMAERLGQPGDLTLLQLKVILFVRRHFIRHAKIARVYAACHGCGLSLSQLRKLFPWGYQRGVCRLAGISYQAIDDDHHALTYETIARRRLPANDHAPRSQPKASGQSHH